MCDRYSHSETAHGKSLWIHQKEQKNYPWHSQNQVVGFSLGLSSHKSSSTNRVEENCKYRKPQHMLGTFLRCWTEFAANALARTKFGFTVPGTSSADEEIPKHVLAGEQLAGDDFYRTNTTSGVIVKVVIADSFYAFVLEWSFGSLNQPDIAV